MTRRTKTMIATVALCLVAVCLVGWLTVGFSDFDVRDRFDKVRNEANEIDLTQVSLKSGRHESGLKVEVDELGAVTLSGTVTEDVTLTYASLTLPAGDYVLTGAEEGSKGTYCLSVEIGEDKILGDWPGEFTVSQSGIVNVKITVSKDTTLRNVKILPVITEGDEAVDFYE